MNYLELQKIQSKKILIGFVIIFVSLIGLITGGVISFQENIELLGISLITIASIEFILSIVISIKYIKKTNKEIRYALYDYFKNEFTKYDGNRIFKSIKGEQVIFNEDSFYIENTGDRIADYWSEIVISDVIRNVDEAVRIRVYKDDEYVTYAKAKANGTPENNTIAFRHPLQKKKCLHVIKVSLSG